jgi:hypothetical protein
MDKDLQAAFDVLVDVFVVDIPALIGLILGIMATPLRAIAAFFEPPVA